MPDADADAMLAFALLPLRFRVDAVADYAADFAYFPRYRYLPLPPSVLPPLLMASAGRTYDALMFLCYSPRRYCR